MWRQLWAILKYGQAISLLIKFTFMTQNHWCSKTSRDQLVSIASLYLFVVVPKDHFYLFLFKKMILFLSSFQNNFIHCWQFSTSLSRQQHSASILFPRVAIHFVVATRIINYSVSIISLHIENRPLLENCLHIQTHTHTRARAHTHIHTHTHKQTNRIENNCKLEDQAHNQTTKQTQFLQTVSLYLSYLPQFFILILFLSL